MYVSRNTNRKFESNVFEITFLLSSTVVLFIAFKVLIDINEKNIYFLKFLHYWWKVKWIRKFFGGSLKTRTNWFNLEHQDSTPKTGTVPTKPGQLECFSDVLFYDWSLLKAVNVLRSYIKLCYVYVHFKQANQTCSPTKNSQSISVEWRTCDGNDKQFF